MLLIKDKEINISIVNTVIWCAWLVNTVNRVVNIVVVVYWLIVGALDFLYVRIVDFGSLVLVVAVVL